MATHTYIVPTIGTGVPEDVDPFRPKYFLDKFGASMVSGAVVGVYNGVDPTFMVTAEVTDEEHAAISANSDVTVLSARLTDVVTSSFVVDLDKRNIPTFWLTPTTTYEEVRRHITQLFTFSQRLQALSNTRLLPRELSLTSRIDALTQLERKQLVMALASFEGMLPQLPPDTELQVLFKLIADQIPVFPISFEVGGDVEVSSNVG